MWNTGSLSVRTSQGRAGWLLGFALVAACLLSVRGSAQGAAPFRLPGHVPAAHMVARMLGPVAPQETVSLALTLPLRNQTELSDLLQQLYDPQDPHYGQYLTPQEFTDRFSPTEAQYRRVAAFAQAQGLTITGVHPNRLVLDVAGPAAVVERAFDTRLQRFLSPSGRAFRAPVIDPAVPAELAGSIKSVVGLSTHALRHPHAVRVPAAGARQLLGSGPGGGLTPTDIRTAYGLNSVSYDGTGQTLALFELDGYVSSDITNYKNQFGLRNVPLQNVLIDGFNGAAGDGRDEVTLDIELQIAVAPGATKILVYEAPNTDQGALDMISKMATDNAAKQISCSWGLAEIENDPSFLNSENTVFQQLAAQGQSFFSASGDDGAFDDPNNSNTLCVDDPASQPFVTGVGGTTLSTQSPGGAWTGETTWNAGSSRNGAGGGGISGVWNIPSYQSGVVSTASKGSKTMRNVPDVAFDADPASGYSIYVAGGWAVYGGTSCAAPIWSAFTALVNQARTGSGSAVAGFLNPALYTIGQGARGAVDFHDIADNSTNLHYPAVTGFDDATGWGSFVGSALLPDLAGTSGGGGGNTYSISGTVTQNTGGGLSGVTVTAGGVSATTAGDGTYTISGVPSGSQTIVPSLASYTFTPTQRAVTVNGNLTGQDFVATPVTHSISGKITFNGNGLGGVTLTAGNAFASTLPDGTYTLAGVLEGTQTVRPALGGYSFSPNSRTLSLTSDLTDINFAAVAVVYSVSGIVTQSTGGGLAGVTITAGSFTATTSVGGTYTLQGVPAGSLTIVPSLAGYSFSPASRNVLVSNNTTGMNFTALPPTYTVSGSVTLNGAPLSGVSVASGTHTAATGSDGRYSLTGVSGGSVTVTPHLTGYTFTPSSQTFTVSGDTPGVDFTATVQSYSISGTVSLTSGGGVPGVTVSAGGQSAVSATDGTYTISGVAAGNQTVTASLGGYTVTPLSRLVTVTSNLSGINFTVSYSGGKLVVSKSVNFGTVKRSQTRSRTLVLQNTSRTDSLLVSVGSSSPSVFQVSNGQGFHTIAPRGKLSLTLLCTPASSGTVSGSFTIRSTDTSHTTTAVTLKVKGK